MREIKVDPENPNVILYDNKILLSKSSVLKENHDVLEFVNRDITADVTIPNYVEKIAPYAFDQCVNLKKIEFQENSNLRIIHKYAFSCTKIESITIPSRVKIIEPYAFNYCHKLTRCTFWPDCEIEMIDSFTFNKSLVKSVSFSSHVKIIKENAFYYCRYLSLVEFPLNSELQVIEKNAFENAYFKVFTIPSSLHEFDVD